MAIATPTPVATVLATPTPTATLAPVPTGAATPTPSPGPRMMEHFPSPTPTVTEAPVPRMSPTPTSLSATVPLPIMQEVATIENYFANQFFPATVIVVKDVPLRLFVTRLHSEHINKFTIEPFLTSTAFFAPGTKGVIDFTPDQPGRFKMHNVGHGYEGDFIVVDSVEDAKRRIGERDIQEFSLIHDLEEGRVYPSRTVVQIGIPVKIYNTSLMGNETMSIDGNYTPGEVNIKGRVITTIEFVPDAAGEFAIRYGDNAIAGTLVVQ